MKPYDSENMLVDVGYLRKSRGRRRRREEEGHNDE